MNRTSSGWSILGASILSIAATVCAHAGTTAVSLPEGTALEYALPVAAAQLKVNLVMQSCDPQVQATPTVAITAISMPSPHPQHHIRIKGSDLMSFTQKRELKIELYPTGSIKSVNGGVANRSGAIFAGFLKVIGGIALRDANGTPVPREATCNGKTRAALDRLKTITGRIIELRASLIAAKASDAPSLQAHIDALAQLAASLVTEDLTLSLSRTIEFPEATNDGVKAWKASGVIEWKASELEKWLDFPAAQASLGKTFAEKKAVMAVENFSVGYCVAPTATEPDDCLVAVAREAKGSADSSKAAQVQCPDRKVRAAAAAQPATSGPSQCSRAIVMREPIAAALTVVALGSDLGGPSGRRLQRARFAMPQWGDLSYVDLTAGWGASKTFALGLDEFGGRSSFGWSSGARGEEWLGATQGVLDAATTLRTTLDGQDLKDKKAELDELDTQQKLNKLAKCRAILDAGGFNCPTQ